jgi:hypothetical protein
MSKEKEVKHRRKWRQITYRNVEAENRASRLLAHVRCRGGPLAVQVFVEISARGADKDCNYLRQEAVVHQVFRMRVGWVGSGMLWLPSKANWSVVWAVVQWFSFSCVKHSRWSCMLKPIIYLDIVQLQGGYQLQCILPSLRSSGECEMPNEVRE